VFDQGLRRRGVGTRALCLLRQFVVEGTELRRLAIITSSDNAASRRIAEKNGFLYVGPPREDPTGVKMIWDVPREPAT
jgi:RimJ/RimL family protein N-acetyltransferase